MIFSATEMRWTCVKPFFKWIKQHPRIERFLGNSENADRIQAEQDKLYPYKELQSVCRRTLTSLGESQELTEEKPIRERCLTPSRVSEAGMVS